MENLKVIKLNPDRKEDIMSEAKEVKLGKVGDWWWAEEPKGILYQYDDIFIDYETRETLIRVNPNTFKKDYYTHLSNIRNLKTGKKESILLQFLGKIEHLISGRDETSERRALLNNINMCLDHKFEKEILEKLITPDR